MLLRVGSNSKEKFGKEVISKLRKEEKEQTDKEADRGKAWKQSTYNYVYHHLLTRSAVRYTEQDLLKAGAMLLENDWEVRFCLLKTSRTHLMCLHFSEVFLTFCAKHSLPVCP